MKQQENLLMGFVDATVSACDLVANVAVLAVVVEVVV